jgi:hypothetical protein
MSNVLNYWDQDVPGWKSVSPPKGGPGPTGQPGNSVVRPSSGGCGFTGSIASLAPDQGALIGNLTAMPGFTDQNPCMTVKNSTSLVAARAGTILISWIVVINGGYVNWHTPTSILQITKVGATHITRVTWTMLWEDTQSLSDVWPNVPLGYDIEFYVQLQLNASVPISSRIYAAMQP